MAVAAALMFVVMSTPLTGISLSDLASRMRSTAKVTTQVDAVAIAQN